MTTFALLSAKTPIISTFDLHVLHDNAGHVADHYAWHAATYVEQPTLHELRTGFIEAICQARTPKACIIAPFGYGKTATIIGLWQACQDAHILAVPPIACTSFTQIAQAVTDWLLYALPMYQTTIRQAHDLFLTASAESLARRDERLFDIPFDQAMAAIRDKLERGYLDFEDISINLVAFLEQITTYVIEAGYAGFAIMIDEFQQLLGNASKGVLVAFRQLIWGLRTRNLPLGLCLTMDPDTERTLADRAGDILHRIKDDGFYLDIRNIYDREFPRRLWQQYIHALGLSKQQQRFIDPFALESLGQLCERDDLSNGPRTVINVFQLAAERFQRTKQRYTPLDLMQNLLDGTIRFDGDRSLLPNVVAELMNFPYFQQSQRRTQALQLIAAFPRGCSREIAQHFNLEDAWLNINEDLRGEIVTELVEGLALIETQRVARPANKLNLLLRRYWMQITDQHLVTEHAVKRFAEQIIPLLFPRDNHAFDGWIHSNPLKLTVDGYYVGLYEGTFSTAYPMRRIKIIVADQQIKFTDDADEDVDFVCYFQLDYTATETTIAIQNGMIIVCRVALNAVVPDGLQSSLRWIQDYLSPQPISLAVVLNLLHYIEQRADESTSERDSVRINDVVQRLHEWFLGELLPKSHFNSLGYDVSLSGGEALRQTLFLLATQRWTYYQPLIKQTQSLAFLNDYIRVLSDLSTDQRIGIAPLVDTKASIAQRFGLNRHAGFESRIRQYEQLLTIEAWQGHEGSLRFHPHPIEKHLIEVIRQQSRVSEEHGYRWLRQHGLSSAETAIVRKLVQIRYDLLVDDGYLSLPQQPTVLELRHRWHQLQTRSQQLTDPIERLTAIEQHITTADETQSLGLATMLDEIEEEILQHEQDQHRAREDFKQTQLQKLAELQAMLICVAIPKTIPQLQSHFEGIYNILNHKRDGLIATIEEAQEDIKRLKLTDIDRITEQITRWQKNHHLYQDWQSLAHTIKGYQQSQNNNHHNHKNAALEDLIDEMRATLAQQGMAGLNDITRLNTMFRDSINRGLSSGFTQNSIQKRVVQRVFSEIGEIFDVKQEIVDSALAHISQKAITERGQAINEVVQRMLAVLLLKLSFVKGDQVVFVDRITQLQQHLKDWLWLLDSDTGELHTERWGYIGKIAKEVVIASTKNDTLWLNTLIFQPVVIDDSYDNKQLSKLISSENVRIIVDIAKN